MKHKITINEGFCTMTKFLEKWYDFTKSDDIAFILSGIKMDPAFFQDWVESVDKVVDSSSSDTFLPESNNS